MCTQSPALDRLHPELETGMQNLKSAVYKQPVAGQFGPAFAFRPAADHNVHNSAGSDAHSLHALFNM